MENINKIDKFNIFLIILILALLGVSSFLVYKIFIFQKNLQDGQKVEKTEREKMLEGKIEYPKKEKEKATSTDTSSVSLELRKDASGTIKTIGDDYIDVNFQVGDETWESRVIITEKTFIIVKNKNGKRITSTGSENLSFLNKGDKVIVNSRGKNIYNSDNFNAWTVSEDF